MGRSERWGGKRNEEVRGKEEERDGKGRGGKEREMKR